MTLAVASVADRSASGAMDSFGDFVFALGDLASWATSGFFIVVCKHKNTVFSVFPADSGPAAKMILRSGIASPQLCAAFVVKDLPQQLNEYEPM
ncbi:MAG: hypothetical protein ACLUYV_06130 [Alistipes shahii]